MARTSTDDSDDFNETYDRKSNKVTRPRRSLRGSPSTIPPRKAQFEKIISKLAGGKRSADEPIIRQFHIPSHILISAKGILKTKKSVSALESLQPTAILYILEFLSGNERIMLALSCKTMASVVEGSPTRQIANLVFYPRWPRRAGFLKQDKDGVGSTADQFIRKGYDVPRDESRWDEERAVVDQYYDLRHLVAHYLGPEYKWCHECKLFRLRDPAWWRQFAQHESPDLLDECGPHAVEKLEMAITAWEAPGTIWTRILTQSPVCPAHVLLAEDEDGQRTIADEPTEGAYPHWYSIA